MKSRSDENLLALRLKAEERDEINRLILKYSNTKNVPVNKSNWLRAVIDEHAKQVEGRPVFQQ